jgi:hypothetical protein
MKSQKIKFGDIEISTKNPSGEKENHLHIYFKDKWVGTIYLSGLCRIHGHLRHTEGSILDLQFKESVLKKEELKGGGLIG